MGTNFYWVTRRGVFDYNALDDELGIPLVHIGKRSAAGHYCYDCRVTLCKGGESRIHSSHRDWHKQCPRCNKEPVAEGLKAGPAAVELGFAAPRNEQPSGVRGCSSFRWAKDPSKVRAACEAHADNHVVIEDEYGRALTGAEFLGMIDANCPVQFMDSIGQSFS